jgi:hypothetical protein
VSMWRARPATGTRHAARVLSLALLNEVRQGLLSLCFQQLNDE